MRFKFLLDCPLTTIRALATPDYNRVCNRY